MEKKSSKPNAVATDRKQRLAAELRANLQKRKAQSRQRDNANDSKAPSDKSD